MKSPPTHSASTQAAAIAVFLLLLVGAYLVYTFDPWVGVFLAIGLAVAGIAFAATVGFGERVEPPREEGQIVWREEDE